MMQSETHSAAYDSLLWHAQMGVDLCVEHSPHALTKAAPPAIIAQAVPANASAASPSAPNAAPALTNVSVAEAVAHARALADGATDLAMLEAAVRTFNGCDLKKTATHTVFADGNAASGLMLIGDAPSADEDRSGVSFCGADGQLLDKILGFIGLQRAAHYYLSHAIFWRPPGNRQPTQAELEICLPFVEKHIALINPKRLVMLGGTVSSFLLRDQRGITRMRGKTFTYTNAYMAAPIPVHVFYHPSYLLRQPLAKKHYWMDALALKTALVTA
jgi:uracil-DNA glycosylase